MDLFRSIRESREPDIERDPRDDDPESSDPC
jgi:hypothetical protein